MVLKYLLRNFKKHIILNSIKIIGLSLALCCILFITLFLKNELSFDSYHEEKSDRIYRYTYTDPNHFDGNHFARAYNTSYIPDLCSQLPEIENYVRLAPAWGVLKYEQNYIDINQGFISDSSFFNVFNAELLSGNPNTILKEPGSVVVSESFAKKVFGDKNPIGQTLSFQYVPLNPDYTVKAIMKDFPQNSHFHPEILFSPDKEDIYKYWAFTYLLLSEDAKPSKLVLRIQDFLADRRGEKKENFKTKVHLQKLTDIHLHSNKLREIEKNNDSSMIIVFTIAAIVLLLISLINYTNLNIGMQGYSSKYLYINNFLGLPFQGSLKYYFMDGAIINIFTLIVTIILFFPSHFLIQEYFLLDLLKGNIEFSIMVIIAFSLLILITGIFPFFSRAGFYLSFKSIQRNHFLPKSKRLSKSLIILQFTFSIILVIAVIVITNQTNFMIKNSMGNLSNNTICIESVQGKYQTFKEELLKHSCIESVSAMFTEFGGESNDMFQFKMEGDQSYNPDIEFNKIGIFPCDYSFPSFFKLNFLSGKTFSQNHVDNDGFGEYIINESAMKYLHYNNPQMIVGKDFQIISNTKDVEIPRGKIIGVVKDFHLSSMKKKVVPLVLFKMKETWLCANIVTYKQGMKKEALGIVKKLWNNLYPGHTLNYEYVGEMYNSIYKTERLQVKLLTLFTIISIFICSMGLLGLCLLITQKRIKEVGIRKVNGAKGIEIFFMLNKELVTQIILAFVLASPVAYFAMNKWLQNFAYKISLNWWIFILAGTLAIGVAFFTISWITFRVALQNPVKALRYE